MSNHNSERFTHALISMSPCSVVLSSRVYHSTHAGRRVLRLASFRRSCVTKGCTNSFTANSQHEVRLRLWPGGAHRSGYQSPGGRGHSQAWLTGCCGRPTKCSIMGGKPRNPRGCIETDLAWRDTFAWFSPTIIPSWPFPSLRKCCPDREDAD